MEKAFMRMGYFFMFFPFAIFILGWVKLPISIPVALLISIVFFKMCKSVPSSKSGKLKSFNVPMLILIYVSILYWVFLSGIGKYAFQNDDHIVRNGIFQLLVEEKWPIVAYAPNPDHFPAPVALVYYIGFWLPAALVGKAFGIEFGWAFQLIWATTEIFLFYMLFLIKFVKRLSLWPLVVFIFFSGLDVLGMALLKIDIEPYWHIEGWMSGYQYSSNTTQLFWVFNQSVPAWLATILVLKQKDNRHLGVVTGLSMITSPLPFIGLLPIAAGVGLSNIMRNPKGMNAPKLGLSIENAIGVFVIGLASFLYLKENMVTTGISIAHIDNAWVSNWLLFFISEAGVLLLLCFHCQNRKLLYYIAAFSLLAIPWFRLANSDNNDFCMRVSIPSLVLLYCFTIESIIKGSRVKDYKTLAAIMIALLIGGITPLMEIGRAIDNTNENLQTGTEYPMDAGHRKNFYGLLDDNPFFEYLAKSPPQ
jgi:hypothetical protein